MEVKDSAENDDTVGRWRLIGDAVTFQVKLLIDGLRDLAMSPLSLAGALLGIVSSPGNPGRYFYAALRWGKSTEQWIDLFGALERKDPARQSGLNELVGRVETAVAEQYARGGITRRAKQGLDEAVDRLHEQISKRAARAGDSEANGGPDDGLPSDRAAKSARRGCD